MIANIDVLWNPTLVFPLLSTALIRKKQRDKNKKNPSEKFSATLSELFNVTNIKGEWINTKDKELDHKQMESKEKVGY